MASYPKFAYVRNLHNKETNIVPIKYIQGFSAHCDEDFDPCKKYGIHRSANDPEPYDGIILMLAKTQGEINYRIKNGPRFKYPPEKCLTSFSVKNPNKVQEGEEQQDMSSPESLDSSPGDEIGSQWESITEDEDDAESSDDADDWNQYSKKPLKRKVAGSSDEEKDRPNMPRNKFIAKACKNLFASEQSDLNDNSQVTNKHFPEDTERTDSWNNYSDSVPAIDTVNKSIPQESHYSQNLNFAKRHETFHFQRVEQPSTSSLGASVPVLNSVQQQNPRMVLSMVQKPSSKHGSMYYDDGINPEPPAEEPNLRNEIQVQRYEKVGDEVHLGSNVFVKDEAWELLEDEESNSKFVKGLITAVYGKRKLMLRTFRTDLLKNKTIQGINTPIKAFSPIKIGVIKQCYKDKLKKNKKIKPKERKRALGKMSEYIAVKRRDIIKQYYQKNGFANDIE